MKLTTTRSLSLLCLGRNCKYQLHTAAIIILSLILKKVLVSFRASYREHTHRVELLDCKHFKKVFFLLLIRARAEEKFELESYNLIKCKVETRATNHEANLQVKSERNNKKLKIIIFKYEKNALVSVRKTIILKTSL